MERNNLIITKLDGYAGIRLLKNNKLEIKPGINLLVGRNGCGKSNLMRLVQFLTTEKGEIFKAIESSFFSNHVSRVLKTGTSNFRETFGQVPIVEFSFEGISEIVSMSLKNEDIQSIVLENLIMTSLGFDGHLDIHKPNFNKKWDWSSSHGGGVRNFEMSAYPVRNIIGLSSEKDLTQMFSQSVNVINEFFERKMLDFLESKEFTSHVKQLEQSSNEILSRFLGMTKKRLIFSNKIKERNWIELFLMDGENRINMEHLSRGENVLINLILSLSTAADNQFDFMAFDEPELHMHDDMIVAFVNEIRNLSTQVPHCKLLIATHSTVLIEQLAGLENEVNLIVFDNDRSVYNSESDIDFINALRRNGVWFTPLMLSKKNNIFIENQGAEGLKHRNLLLKFFSKDNKPNIVPIGSGGNVEQSESFSKVLSDLITIPSFGSVGIRDGDLWIKKHLVSYLKGNLELIELISKISKEENIYLKGLRKNQLYFNFWEIENLYLFDEILHCWQKNGKSLDSRRYLEILNSHQKILCDEYIKTFFKTISYSRIGKPSSMGADLKKYVATSKLVENFSNSIEVLELKTVAFCQELIRCNLKHWLPGKEIQKLLRLEGYAFDDSEFNHCNSHIGKRIQMIFS